MATFIAPPIGTAEVAPCKQPCSHRLDIVNCTQADCMWCSNQKRCVDSNAYVPSFPYGQCLEWCTKADGCPGMYTIVSLPTHSPSAVHKSVTIISSCTTYSISID